MSALLACAAHRSCGVVHGVGHIGPVGTILIIDAIFCGFWFYFDNGKVIDMERLRRFSIINAVVVVGLCAIVAR